MMGQRETDPTPRDKIFADASPLIALARIKRLDLLTSLPVPIYVTDTVWREVTSNATLPGVAELIAAQEVGLLHIVPGGDPAAYPQLDAGEASTLSAAAREGAAIIIDEQKARAIMRGDPVLSAAIPAIIGTVGLILVARNRGYIPLVRPILDALRQETFRLSNELYEEVLRAADEWPPS